LKNVVEKKKLFGKNLSQKVGVGQFKSHEK